MTAIIGPMAEHFACLEYNTHNQEILVVFIPICKQPALKHIVPFKHKVSERWVLITGKGEEINLSRWANACKVSKNANNPVLYRTKASSNCCCILILLDS